MRLIDPSHPVFEPAWCRYLIVAAPFACARVGLGTGNTIRAHLFAAIGGTSPGNPS